MKRTAVILSFLSLTLCDQACAYTIDYAQRAFTDTIPSKLLGNFLDDYGIRYSISDTLWTQLPNIRYHIIRWNIEEQYLLARNDDKNPSEPGLYTRIDYMSFSNMEPYLWGFCLTVYNAANIEEARSKAKAERQNPRKGCNGFPFSRMKRSD